MHSSTRVRAVSRPAPDLRVAVVGMLLIASTYGMARFGVGLFAPQLTDERPALAPVVAWAGAAQFTSYAIAAAAAARLADRRPRIGLLLAGVTASLGCVGVAVATHPAVFVAAVFVGGMGAGFASPALVRVIDAVVSGSAASTAQSIVNTGTAVGVVGAGVLTYVTDSAALAWGLMAVACAVPAGAVLFLVRHRTGLSAAATGGSSSPTGTATRDWTRLVAPAVAALLVGAGSALIWTFGPLLTTRAGAVEAGHVGWLWIALGLGGLGGLFTGTVVDRLGLQRGWILFAAALALANLALALSVGLGVTWVAFASVAAFGAGYMCLSGVLILWARAAWPSAGGAGTSVLFIALAVGQAVGSVGFEAVLGHLGPPRAALAAAAVCGIGGWIACLPDPPTHSGCSPRRRGGRRRH